MRLAGDQHEPGLAAAIVAPGDRGIGGADCPQCARLLDLDQAPEVGAQGVGDRPQGRQAGVGAAALDLDQRADADAGLPGEPGQRLGPVQAERADVAADGAANTVTACHVKYIATRWQCALYCHVGAA